MFFKNQSVAPLVGARIYRSANALALHSKAKERYQNNARSVPKIIGHQFGDLEEIFLVVNSTNIQCQSLIAVFIIANHLVSVS